MHPLVALNQTLRAAATMLDLAASQIRDGHLEPVRGNIDKIGETLVSIFEIQEQIYKQAPELNLEPQYEELPEHERLANRRLGEAILAADELAIAGKCSEARTHLANFAASELSEKHRELALIQGQYYAESSDT